MDQYTYDPNIFAVNDIPAAMKIILTAEGGMTTEERWRVETPYVADLIGRSMKIHTNSIILDYGCGIGRLAKELIARYGCRVLGIDISPTMRALSVLYVQSDRFLACAPDMLDGFLEKKIVCDAAISAWVLQHCFNPNIDVARIHQSLKTGARFFVLNNLHRVVPTRESRWADDGIDVKSLLKYHFAILEEGQLPPTKFPAQLVTHTFWANFERQD